MSINLPSADNVSALRRDYMQRALNEADLAPDPIRQFELWFEEARHCAEIAEVNAMVLSTVSPEGQPHARYVLLKGFDVQGFVFFTNYLSEKGRDLEANPRAALTFGWIEQERQVRIEGITSQMPRSAVEAYFESRPRGSRLGAWASHQSAIIPSRDTLTDALSQAETLFPNDVPPPPEWGGYRLAPERIEFWQGRTNRLHDRLRYRKEESRWIVERLAP